MTAVAKQKEPTNRERLTALAKDALKKANGDTAVATTALVKVLLHKKELLRELAAEIVLAAANSFVRERLHYARRAIMNPRHQSSSSVVDLARGLNNAGMNFPLSDGTKLRDASRAQVSRQADIYETQGRDMVRKGRWLRSVAQSLPEDKLVGEVLDEKRVNELWEASAHA